MLQEKLITEKGKSYWDNNGVYQKEFDELFNELVPNSGDSETIHGELIRCASRLFYEYCNNGNCNAVDIETVYETETEDCHDCQGNGVVYNDCDEDEIPCLSCDGTGNHEYEEEYDGDRVITEYYSDMINFLRNNLIDNQVVYDLIEFMKDASRGYGKYSFSDDEMNVYNRLTDQVMYQVLNTNNSKNKFAQ